MKTKNQSFAVWIPRYLESITATVHSRSLDEVAYALRRFAAWAKKRGLCSPRQIRIEDLVPYCGRKPFSARYLGKQIGQLRFFFRWWSLLSGAPNPAHSLKAPARPRALPRPLDPALLQGWLDTQSEKKPTSLRNRAILEMLYACGIRKQELCGLTLDDLDLQNHQIRILHGKAGRQSVVPLAQRSEAWLLAYLERARPLLLRGADDRSLWIDRYGRRYNYGALTVMLAHSKAAAGIQAYGSAHLFRHSFASHLLSAGASIRVIQELLGHADLTSTQIYTQADISDLKRVHARCHPFEAHRA